MAHITLVLNARSVDASGNKLTEEAIVSMARQLEQKFGNGSVKVHNSAIKVAVDGPQCVCGKRDCYGPEHERWCPLWNETEIKIEQEVEQDE